MNRTLRRPMFRMGGSAEGITSGLSMPRQGYKDAKLVEVPEEKGAPISQDLIDAGIFRTGGPKKILLTQQNQIQLMLIVKVLTNKQLWI